MKSEKLRALTFIVVGCIGAAALGFIVWQASSPTRPTLDIAMHTTTTTTPAPTGFESPVQSALSVEDPDLNNQSLAAVDTADPYLAPNAFLAPHIRNTPTTTTLAPPFTPEASATSATSATQSREPSTTRFATDTERTESRTPDSGDTEPRPADSVDREPSIPETTAPQETSQPEITTPPADDEPDASEDTPTPVLPTEPTVSETETPEVIDPTPTDFIEEPTAPLNPEQPSTPESPTVSPSATTVDTDTVTDILVD